MKNNEREVTLKMIKQQVEIWGDYYYEEGEYRDDTIFLDTGDTAVFDPFVSECMRFNVDPEIYYGKQAFYDWLSKITEYILYHGVR